MKLGSKVLGSILVLAATRCVVAARAPSGGAAGAGLGRRAGRP